jgi:hypothetical protein
MTSASDFQTNTRSTLADFSALLTKVPGTVLVPGIRHILEPERFQEPFIFLNSSYHVQRFLAENDSFDDFFALFFAGSWSFHTLIILCRYLVETVDLDAKVSFLRRSDAYPDRPQKWNRRALHYIDLAERHASRFEMEIQGG